MNKEQEDKLKQFIDSGGWVGQGSDELLTEALADPAADKPPEQSTIEEIAPPASPVYSNFREATPEQTRNFIESTEANTIRVCTFYLKCLLPLKAGFDSGVEDAQELAGIVAGTKVSIEHEAASKALDRMILIRQVRWLGEYSGTDPKDVDMLVQSMFQKETAPPYVKQILSTLESINESTTGQARLAKNSSQKTNTPTNEKSKPQAGGQ